MTVAVAGKGGVGKTTTAAAVGDALRRLTGWSVALVDGDPQASLSAWLAPGAVYTVADVLGGRLSAADALVHLGRNLAVLPAADTLVDVERSLTAERVAAEVLLPLDVDVAVIDTPASRPVTADGAPMLSAALQVADIVVVPFSLWAHQTDALQRVLTELDAAEQVQGRELPVYLMPARVARAQVQVAQGAVELAQAVSTRRFLPYIRESAHVGRAASSRQLLADYAADSAAVADYAAVAAALATALVGVA